MENFLGWSASIILVVTLSYQVLNQWKTGSSKGVSPWLFIGQLIASITFSIYSVLVNNAVFMVTNALIAVSALVGLIICLHHRRKI